MVKEFEKFTISQAAILIKDNKCLIGEDASHPGRWALPGGRIDKGEDRETAFRRELIEEINLPEFKVIELIDYHAWHNNEIARASVIFLIEAEIDKIKAGEEFSQLKWVEEKDLDNYNFIWDHAIQAIKKGFKVYRNIQ